MAYKYFSLTLIVLSLLFLAYVRFAPSNPDQWHVDPETATLNQMPHHYRVLPEGGDAQSPVYALNVEQLSDKLSALLDGAEKLSGDLQDGHATYIVRTKLLQYPDYISIKLREISQNTSTFAIYSRSRFGYSDGGLNKQRLQDWLTALRPFQVGG